NSQIDEACNLLEQFSGKRIGVLGITFKPGTDDVRESPMLELMARLRRKGENVKAYDPNIDFGPALAGQLAYVKHANPGQGALIEELESLCVETGAELLETVDVVIVSHATPEFKTLVSERNRNVHVLDLARLFKQPHADQNYEGIAW
ncbi:MAG: UDP binding domain-containing protein, partial [Hyphomicrobiaceae bacterium]